jgi:subtilisin family serine protease
VCLYIANIRAFIIFSPTLLLLYRTHCAGTVCGKTYGVASKTKPILCAVKVLDSSGSGSWDAVISGIDHVVTYCTNSSIKRQCVVNMSLGGGKSSTVNNAVATAVSKGVVMVVAAGNDNQDACNYSPASSSNAITVGSTTSSDAKSTFSNFCPTTSCCVDIFAPGSGVLSAWSTSDTATNTISGTSMASPRKLYFARLFAYSTKLLQPIFVPFHFLF